jgi:hypothetical protein
MGLQVLTAADMKMAVFFVVASRGLSTVLTTETTSPPETSVDFYQAAWHNI